MRFGLIPLFTATIAFAAADTARGQGDGPVMEIVTFRLTPGLSDADFMALAKGTAAMVAAQPGFIRRSLLCDEAGVWTDAVEWQTLGLAHAAAEKVMATPSFAPFAAAIDMASLSMRHVRILWQMGD
ncbi:MAG: hypothetical protein MUD11_15800 [Rhodobacteraceae bacterium]|nr:hypothetical protein [Paracoccaceae bacterium]